MPKLEKIDHIHIYAPDRLSAEQWYKEVLGFNRVEPLERWFLEGGPLTIENGGVHIALFESDTLVNTTVAFSVDSTNYEEWKAQLGNHGVDFKESDHALSWSIYFSDPYGNPYEITSYEYEEIKKQRHPSLAE